jgi:hypothetical protein
MPTLALALTMLALEQAVTASREQASLEPDPAPLDAAGLAAQAVAWRRWAAEGRDSVADVPASSAGSTVRRTLQTPAGG